jgi:hypothetical protein
VGSVPRARVDAGVFRCATRWRGPSQAGCRGFESRVPLEKGPVQGLFAFCSCRADRTSVCRLTRALPGSRERSPWQRSVPRHREASSEYLASHRGSRRRPSRRRRRTRPRRGRLADRSAPPERAVLRDARSDTLTQVAALANLRRLTRAASAARGSPRGRADPSHVPLPAWTSRARPAT